MITFYRERLSVCFLGIYFLFSSLAAVTYGEFKGGADRAIEMLENENKKIQEYADAVDAQVKEISSKGIPQDSASLPPLVEAGYLYLNNKETTEESHQKIVKLQQQKIKVIQCIDDIQTLLETKDDYDTAFALDTQDGYKDAAELAEGYSTLSDIKDKLKNVLDLLK